MLIEAIVNESIHRYTEKLRQVKPEKPEKPEKPK